MGRRVEVSVAGRCAFRHETLGGKAQSAPLRPLRKPLTALSLRRSLEVLYLVLAEGCLVPFER